MAQSRQERQRAQRRTARELRQKGGYQSKLPEGIRERGKEARRGSGEHYLNHPEARKDATPLERRQLARLAAQAKRGRGNPAFYEAFKDEFYHDDKG